MKTKLRLKMSFSHSIDMHSAKQLQDMLVEERDKARLNSLGMLPVVVESLGGWHEDAAAVVNKIARQLGSHTGKEAEEPIRHLFQRLSLLLWRDDQCHAGDKPVLECIEFYFLLFN
jgi:hypothetical protein